MDFEFTDEQVDLRKAAREFAEEEFDDKLARECDREEKFPEELWKKACELGFVGATIPEEYGGGGLGMMEGALLQEEFWRVDPGLASCLITSFGSEMIVYQGSEEQREKYLPSLAKGEAITGAAITEPETGTDVATVSTRGIKDGDEWVINGSKQFITNGTLADFLVVLCLTDPDEPVKYNRHSIFLVEADRDGFEANKIGGKMGIRASDTAELSFDEVRVPEENLIGERGSGFYNFMEFFNLTRIGVAAQAVGVAQGALDLALEYSKERETFGQPLAKHQGLRWYLADMVTETEASRNLVYKAAWKADNKYADPGLVAMAKKKASRTAVEIADKALQIHGGYGYIDEYKVQRFYRDAKITEIYEGTTEAENLTICSQYLKI